MRRLRMDKSKRDESVAKETSASVALERAYGSVKSMGRETRDFKDIIREAKEAKAEETLRKMGEQ